MSAPKAARLTEIDPVIAAFENAPEEPMTDEERAAFEEALGDPRPGISTEELLERLRGRSRELRGRLASSRGDRDRDVIEARAKEARDGTIPGDPLGRRETGTLT